MKKHTWRDYWTIYANGIGGWFAWNARKSKRVNLLTVGTLAEAEKELLRMHEAGELEP